MAVNPDAVAPRAEPMAENNRMSKAEIAVLLTLVFISLCIALYNAWIAPLAAFAVLLILAVAVLGYSGFK